MATIFVHTELSSNGNELEQKDAKITSRIEERNIAFDVNRETEDATIVAIDENPYYEGVRMSQILSN